ncbi:SpoIIIAH-like family protein [Paenibacillus flagellatus]|uniref:SpoIIIAH-like family protein n=1 Tax=Paenibacillus flagellatus TaxID=2211139 RepID=A0A2V5KTI5_9BACL|nr:SpoIIIAH-like family protein [Paenibacillus flagellatus]PYI55057.1 hypothetical protein DLM86_10995 [Paenibacillus flagellatus]
MNTKRQTVWLVSMLSLMVVLSAYYLFTEDVNELDLTAQQLSGSEIKVDAVSTGGGAKTDAAAGDKAAADKAAADKAGADQAAANQGASTDKAASGKTSGGTDATSKKTDEEVLKQVTAKETTGSDYFASLQMKRSEELAKQTEKWMTISLDSKKSTEEVTQAMNELNKLQDTDEKVTGLEDQLAQSYKNAIVLQEGGKWKVVVQAAKLEKSEGVSIVDLVMKELNVTPDKVTVQYVQ